MTLRPSGPPNDRADRLEQRFVFRLGRMVPLGLAVAAAGLGLLAVLVATGSLIHVASPEEPTPPAMPPVVAVSAADVQAALAPAAAAPAERVALATQNTSTPAAAVDIARRLHAVRVLLAAARAPWTDQYETVCLERLYGYCFRSDTRRSATGIGSLLTDVVDLYDEPAPTALAQVTIQDTVVGRAQYTVNYSAANANGAILDEARAIVAARPVGERRAALAAWSRLRIEREHARRQQVAAEEARVERERAAAAAAYAEKVDARRAWRQAALLTAGVMLGAIIALAILLGILAIERNTRALRERAEGGEVRDRGVVAPPVTPFSPARSDGSPLVTR